MPNQIDYQKLRRKIGPLRYQSSESDCVPTTVVNGLLVLLGRRIHPRLLHMIWAISLDASHGTGSVSCHTLSSILNNWFTSAYQDGWEKGQLPFVSDIIEGDAVHLRRNNPLTRSINAGGICFLVTSNGGHYSLLHSVNGGEYIGFDPYLKLRKGSIEQSRIYAEYSGLANVIYQRHEIDELFRDDGNQWLHVIEPVVFT